MISIEQLPNGFEYINIKNDFASAKIALQGAQVYQYTRKDEDDILWVSDTSDFEYGKKIRGGVPVCWPWFGMQETNPEYPQHGFARTALFELLETKEIDTNISQVTLKLNNSKDTLLMWPYYFELLVKITVGDKLIMELTTTNMDEVPFEITQAFHTYFNISNISNITIVGLNDKPYFDALSDEQCKQNGDITFNQEVDRVYQEVNNEIKLVDKQRTIKIKNDFSSSVIVWNPWIDKCKRLAGLRDDAYNNFVCIESANAMKDFIVLEPQDSHTLRATIF